MKKLKIESQLVALLALFASGCASILPPATDQARDLAISFTPLPQSAGFYFFGQHFGGSGISDVYLDGNKVGRIQKNTYLYLPILPGEHTVGNYASNIGGDVGRSAVFNAKAGENYCFYFSWGPKLIDEDKARAYASNDKLSGDCVASSPADYLKKLLESNPPSGIAPSAIQTKGFWSDQNVPALASYIEGISFPGEFYPLTDGTAKTTEVIILIDKARVTANADGSSHWWGFKVRQVVLKNDPQHELPFEIENESVSLNANQPVILLEGKYRLKPVVPANSDIWHISFQQK